MLTFNKALSLGVFAAIAISVSSLHAADQVSGLKVRHQEGQTFLTWKEVDPPITEASPTVKAVRAKQKELSKGKKVRYRIYRSNKPIESLDGLKPMASVRPMTCWNTEYYGVYPKDHHKALRWAVEDGKPVEPGTGIFAYHPKEAGSGYYAVTISVDDKENTALGEGNVWKEAVAETKGQGPFVLQRIVKPTKAFLYTNGATLNYFARWEGPPNCSIDGKPFDYLVAVPKNVKKPATIGVHLHCWGGNLNGGYGWWSNASQGAILISSNQIPYDWWTGYHEHYWSKRPKKNDKAGWQSGVVRAYSQTRMLSFLDWAAKKWDGDLTKTFVVGNSMGGSGAPMFAIRHPDRFAWCRSWVGVHVPALTPQFKGSYAGVYGAPEMEVKFEDGTPVWDYFSDPWYLRKYPKKEIGFISFSNGKNDGAIGWPQAVQFFRAMQETRRPHIFIWGQAGHGQRTTMPKNLSGRDMCIDARTNQALPAFTNCSLDSNPGTGRRLTKEELAKQAEEIKAYNQTHKRKRKADKYDGHSGGQANLYLYWETKDLVDTPESLEITVGLVAKAPKDECSVDVTPRRVQKFKFDPGTKLKWTCGQKSRFAGATEGGGEGGQSGEVEVDEHGLITLKQVKVTKATIRIKITK